MSSLLSAIADWLGATTGSRGETKALALVANKPVNSPERIMVELLSTCVDGGVEFYVQDTELTPQNENGANVNPSAWL